MSEGDDYAPSEAEELIAMLALSLSEVCRRTGLDVEAEVAIAEGDGTTILQLLGRAVRFLPVELRPGSASRH